MPERRTTGPAGKLSCGGGDGDEVGVYREVGFKMGAWRDVGWWGKTLGPAPATPAEPVPFAALDI